MQRADQPHANRRSTTAAASGQLTRRDSFGARQQPVHRRRRLRSQPRRLRPVDRARLSQSRSQRHRRRRVRRRRDRRRGRRRAVRHPRRSRRPDPDLERSTRPTRCRSRARGTSRCPAATTARRSAIATASSPAAGRARSTATTRFSRFNPAVGVTFSPSRDAQCLRRLQRRQPRGDVDRAGLRRPGGAVQAAQRDGRRPAARAGRHADVGSGRARRAIAASNWNAGALPRRQPRRHPVRHVGADRLRLLQELRRDAPAGDRARRERPGRTGHASAPATRSSTRRSRARRRSTARATAPTTPRRPADAGLEGAIEIEPGDRIPLIPRAHVQGVRRRAGRRRRSSLDVDVDRGLELVTRAATRTTSTSRTASTTSAPGRLPATPSSTSARAIASSRGCRSWRRSTICSTAATTRPRSSGRRGSPTRARSSRGRFRRSMASSRFSRRRFFAPGAPARVWVGARFRFP